MKDFFGIFNISSLIVKLNLGVYFFGEIEKRVLDEESGEGRRVFLVIEEVGG